jgi:glucosamine-6-phosphate deaminase
MRFREFKDESQVAAAATDELFAAVRTKPAALVILPAGRTPRPLFAEILRRAKAGGGALGKVRFVQLDEYVGCGAKDPRSFRSLLRHELLDPLGRDPDADLLIDGAAKDPRAEIERHGARLRAEGGADLCFLGLGRNGHVAFNEPGTTLADDAREVELAPATRAAAEADFGAGKAPTRGITLGLREIAASRPVVRLGTGATKASILAALFDEPPSPVRPASLLLAHRDLRILADAAAAPRRARPPRGVAKRPS